MDTLSRFNLLRSLATPTLKHFKAYIIALLLTSLVSVSTNADTKIKISEAELREAAIQGADIRNRIIDGEDLSKTIFYLTQIRAGKGKFEQCEICNPKSEIRIIDSVIVGEISSNTYGIGFFHISNLDELVKITILNSKLYPSKNNKAITISDMNAYLNIQNSDINGLSSFKYLQLSNDSTLTNNKFNGDVKFSNVVFADKSKETVDRKEDEETTGINGIIGNIFLRKFEIRDSSIASDLNISKNSFNGLFSASDILIAQLDGLLKLQNNKFESSFILTRFNYHDGVDGNSLSMSHYLTQDNPYSIPFVWGDIDLGSSIFSGMAFFQEINVRELLFSPATDDTYKHADLHDKYIIYDIPTQFKNGFVFFNSACDVCDFHYTIISGAARFDSLRARTLNLNRSTFNNTLSFQNTIFWDLNVFGAIYNNGFEIDDSTLNIISNACSKPVPNENIILKRRQCINLLYKLSSIYEKAGDNNSAIEAKYLYQKYNNPNIILDMAWGYSYRPWNLVATIFIFFIAYTLCYATQIPMHAKTIKCAAQNLAHSFNFSFQCVRSFNLKFATENTKNKLFRCLAISEVIIFKIFLALLLYSLSQTSPILKTILDAIH
ncbi:MULTISPECIES: hypothetical protein [unclassified Klebsiella]|uniref:hypothetical protein n=2 Tax=Klebsiella TaxID=570 RepID=UPI000C2A9BA8|nr:MULTISPECIES: hypothetical protein [unclassified Klebsiella]PJX43664.1 hypothetical protein CWM62_08200 [Klebsiella sp. C-Nf10]PJX54384.1 hypothetical protein CWM54_02260 [Klebsiella sp. D-Nf1]